MCLFFEHFSHCQAEKSVISLYLKSYFYEGLYEIWPTPWVFREFLALAACISTAALSAGDDGGGYRRRGLSGDCSGWS
jgi:hypothetical protein